FYRLFAFFNNVPEQGRAIKLGNSPPYIQAPTPDQQRALAAVEANLAAAEQTFQSLPSRIDQEQRRWEKSVPRGVFLDWSPSHALQAHYPLDGDTVDSTGKSTRAKALEGPAAYGTGMHGRCLQLDGRRYLEVPELGAFGFFDKFSLSAWVRPHG